MAIWGIGNKIWVYGRMGYWVLGIGYYYGRTGYWVLGIIMAVRGIGYSRQPPHIPGSPVGPGSPCRC